MAGHVNVLQYGYGMFKTAIKTTITVRNQMIVDMAYAVRLAFASEDDFKAAVKDLSG